MNKIIIQYFVTVLFIILPLTVVSQNGTIKGKVINARTNQPIEFASIQIQGTIQGTTSGENGDFVFTDVEPGFVRVIVSFVG